MLRRRLRRHHDHDPADINITAFLNLMVILIPFLLITAVFTRMAVLELNLAGPSQPSEEQEKLRLEVTVRDNALVVGDGRRILAEISATENGGHDYERLSTLMRQIKESNPDVLKASVLLEADTEYDVLVHVMDAVRVAKVADPEQPGQTRQAELFPEIALGDAPGGT